MLASNLPRDAFQVCKAAPRRTPPPAPTPASPFCRVSTGGLDGSRRFVYKQGRAPTSGALLCGPGHCAGLGPLACPGHMASIAGGLPSLRKPAWLERSERGASLITGDAQQLVGPGCRLRGSDLTLLVCGVH